MSYFNSAGKINQLSSQLAEIVQYNTGKGLYNTEKGLARYRVKQNPTIVAFGDSITEGAGGLVNDQIWAERVKARLALQHGLYGKGNGGLINWDGTWPTGWTQEDHGTNIYRIYSGAGAGNVKLHSNIQHDFKVDILYSTELDGGSFDIVQGGTTIATVSCQGATSYHNVYTVTNTKGTTLELKPTGKAYVETAVYYAYDNQTAGWLFLKMGHGGKGLHDYSYAELDATVPAFHPDLTIMAMMVNDNDPTYLADYKAKAEYVIQKAKLTGDCIIQINVEGYSFSDSVKRQNWLDMKNFLYGLAQQYNCALVDLDEFFGGYTNAQANGFFLSDNVHPSIGGHYAISDLVTYVLDKNSLAWKPETNIDWSGSVGNFDIKATKPILPFGDNGGLFNFTSFAGGFNATFTDITNNKNFGFFVAYGRADFFGTVSIVKVEVPFQYTNTAEFIGGFLRIPSAAPSSPYQGEIFVDNPNNKLKYTTNYTVKTVQAIQNGLTANRPSKPLIGESFFDQTINKPVWCKTAAVIDGSGNVTTAAVWVDATGTTV